MQTDASAPVEPRDEALDDVLNWFRQQARMEERFGAAIRQSFDEVYDGQRTGRYRIDQLSKVEKTYIGTKAEIVVESEFGLQRGRRMDYRVAGHEVDAKWSMKLGGWMIPTEAVGELCLCLTADDMRGRFSVGLIRVSLDRLTESRNKDSKARVSPSSLSSMAWLAQEAALPENLLLNVDDETRNAMLDTNISGQRRVNELFHRVQERIIRREVVLTVARQDDGPKRVRDARKHLRKFGVVILGHQGSHPTAAKVFGIPVPRKGEWVSVAVADAEAGAPGAALIDGEWKSMMYPPGTGT